MTTIIRERSELKTLVSKLYDKAHAVDVQYNQYDYGERPEAIAKHEELATQCFTLCHEIQVLLTSQRGALSEHHIENLEAE